MASLIKDEQDGVVIARFQGGRIIDEAQIESLGKQLNELLTCLLYTSPSPRDS